MEDDLYGAENKVCATVRQRKPNLNEYTKYPKNRKLQINGEEGSPFQYSKYPMKRKQKIIELELYNETVQQNFRHNQW